MEFVRKKKRGMDQRFEKVWFSEGHQYRITWSKRVFGVAVTPHYHACVRSVLPDGTERWEFAGRRGPFKKLNTAIDAADKHRKVWEAALVIAAERKGRSKALASLLVRTGVVLRATPAWANRDLVQIIQAVLFPKGRRVEDDDECSDPDPSDPSNPSPTTESSSSTDDLNSQPTQPNGLAPSATVEASNTKAESRRVNPPTTSATPAKGAAKVRKPRAKRSTTGSSKTGKTAPKRSTRKKRSASPDSQN